MSKNMYKDTPTEFEVQAAAYTLLKAAGYNVRGEVSLKTKNGRGCRFDLVIFDDTNNPILTIEVKDNPKAPPHSKKAYYEQMAKCPNIQISGMGEALRCVDVVGSFL